jgi:hypothetical protein
MHVRVLQLSAPAACAFARFSIVCMRVRALQQFFCTDCDSNPGREKLKG